jgi:hypothetical protein
MDAKNFKKIIKEAVREAIQEELREILLEAVKAPKTTVVTEANNTIGNSSTATKTLTPAERKAMFGGILEDMQYGKPANTNNIPFRPTGPVDAVNGKLPEGEVDLSQIMGLMSK